VVEAVVAALFATWLAATLATAVEGSRPARLVRRADVLGLVPGWSFFAPNPGTFDYHLLARPRHPDGSTGPFTEIAPPRSRLRRSIWHPEKRVRKLIFDCCQELVTLRDAGRSGAEYTVAYLTLLNLAGSRVDQAGTASVQFLLVRSGRHVQQPELLVRSRFHPVST
jgi:hypothetical protein